MNVRQYSLTLFYKLSDVAKPLALTPLFVKQYGTEAFGIYAALFAFCLLIYPIIDLGISFGSQRFLYHARKEDRHFATKLMLTQTLVYLAVSAAILCAFKYWEQRSTLPFLQVVAALLYGYTLAISNTFSGFFRAFGKFTLLVKLKSISDVLEFTSLITWIYITTEYDHRYFIIMSLIRALFICKCYFAVFHESADDKPPAGFSSYPNLRTFFKASLPVVPLALVGSINSNASRFFIGHNLGITEIGIFSVVSMYIFYLKYIAFPVTFIGTSSYAKLYDSGDFSQLSRKATTNISAILAMTVAAAIPIYFVDEYLFYRIIGIASYPQLDMLVAILAISVVAANANSVMSTLLSVFGNIAQLNRISFVSMAINLIFMACTIEKLGLISPALALMTSTLFETVLMAFLTCKKIAPKSR